jgi:hypothetical protein
MDTVMDMVMDTDMVIQNKHILLKIHNIKYARMHSGKGFG